MKLSFFCKHCGLHIKHGDHRECKKILRRQGQEDTLTARKAAEAKALAKAEQDDFLAEVDASGYYPESE